MNLVFATNNPHKLYEIRSLTKDSIHISGLSEAGFTGEIPEDFPTLEENASQKAWYIYNRIRRDCFADDTGLEVEALGGEPGVFSARYSRVGNIRFPDMDVTEGNIRKLLLLLENEENRKARFRTVIAMVIKGVEYQFEGIITGTISRKRSGREGFGYDPVFVPTGEKQSFADMEPGKKNSISHRAMAMKKLLAFLNDL